MSLPPETTPKILLVGDDPADEQVLRSLLGGMGVDLVQSHTGEAALELVGATEYAVVLLSVKLHGMHGLQTAVAILATPRAQHTPILLLVAGDPNPALLEQGYAVGAVDFLTKPLQPSALQAKVRMLVTLFQEKQRARRELEQLRLLVDGTKEYAIFMLDPQGRVATWNSGAERIKGYRARDIIGQHFSKFYTKDDIQRGWPDYELKVAQQEGRFEDEGWRLRQDGVRFWANVVITALRDGTGKLLGYSKITRDLTERKNTEENARRLVAETTARRVAEENSRLIEVQRERLHVTLASIGDAVICTDAQGRIDFLNPVAQELVGWTEAEAVHQPLADVFHIVNEETRLPVENPAMRSLREGRIVGLANHTILISRDGTERPIDDSAAPIRTKDGTLLGCVLVFRDVSQRRADEKAIHDSEQRYRLVGEAANDAIWDWDLLTNQVVWSEGLQRVFGYQEADVDASANWWLENIHPEDRERISTDIHAAIDGDRDLWQNEYRYRRANGSYAIVFDKGRILRQANRPVRMVGSMLDITERQLAEAALKIAEDRFDFVRKSSGVGFWYCDLPFDVLQWDEQVKLHFHLPKDTQVTIDTFYNYIHPADREPTRVAIERSIQERTSYDVVYRTVDPANGAQKSIRAIGRTVYNEQGQPIQFDGVTVDVTEQERVEAELRQVAAALSDAAHRKDEFLATLAHELRNPLAPILNALQIMRLSTDPQFHVHAQNMMDRQLSQLIRLVDDLMDISRITRGKVELRKEHVPLAAVIQSAVETSRPVIEQMEQSLDVALPPAAVVVDVDPTRLAQVFANLLNNAAKYSDRGGHIALTVEVEASQVAVSIRDSGIGIDPDQQKRIFELFAQVERSLERAQGGLGIGLTLVKRLVEMHAGTIEVKSEGAGRGSEFVVTLPVVALPASVGQGAGVGVTPPTLTKQRILVADDSMDAVTSLAILLRVMGNEVITASDGLAAVEMAERFAPAVILLDIGMPVLNGLEACRRIRQQPGGKHATIVALTGWGQDEDRRLTTEAGFDHHLVKPVDPGVLARLLASSKQQ